MRRRRGTALAVVLGVAAGCSGPANGAGSIAFELGESPASWRGERTTLTLQPDGTYRRLEAADTPSGTMGRWHRVTGTPGDIALVTPTGERELWRAAAGGGLEALDPDGALMSPVPLVAHDGDPVSATGLFSYFADAALFVTCGSGIQLPVAMEEGYLSLERRYGESPAAGGAPLPVRVAGRIEARLAVDAEGTEPFLVVEGWEDSGGAPCPAGDTRAALLEEAWTLVAIDGDPIGDLGEVDAPTLQWTEPNQIAGFSGCNQFSGRGVLRGTLLVSEPLAATRMFCDGSMDLESRYLAILGAGGAWLRDGAHMVLYEGPEERARFARMQDD
jgi:heat shock protein HslJ/uncharacterized lipoprotein NlpE involved in copper resistance